jgi:L-ascorbate metabolism protein UlaG (beta-lactamase superfamily)
LNGLENFFSKKFSKVLILLFILKLQQNAPNVLVNGCATSELFGEKSVFVFISHSHGNHFNEVVFDWQARLKYTNIQYIVSSDVAAKLNGKYITRVFNGRESRKADDVGITTIHSTDIGVAWFIEIDGCRIYHAGDHGNRVRNIPL